MRTLIKGAAAVMIAGLAAFAPVDADATTFREMTEAERIDEADIILRGTVTEVWTERDDNGVIWTRAQVDVGYVLKGDPELEAVVVDQMGGEWAGLRMVVGGAARFSQGEQVVLLLEPLASGRLVTSGMLHGKYTVRMDPRSRQHIVQRFAPAQTESYDHRFIPMPSAERRVKLSDFEGRILDRVHGKVAPAAPAEVK